MTSGHDGWSNLMGCLHKWSWEKEKRCLTVRYSAVCRETEGGRPLFFFTVVVVVLLLFQTVAALHFTCSFSEKCPLAMLVSPSTITTWTSYLPLAGIVWHGMAWYGPITSLFSVGRATTTSHLAGGGIINNSKPQSNCFYVVLYKKAPTAAAVRLWVLFSFQRPFAILWTDQWFLLLERCRFRGFRGHEQASDWTTGEANIHSRKSGKCIIYIY